MPTERIERINFGKIEEVIPPPNLIKVQVDSYREFLQIKNQEGEVIDPESIDPKRPKRDKIGLQAVFEEIFPVKSYDEKCELDFVLYKIGEPKVSWLECLREGLTFSASLHVKFRLKDEQGVVKEEMVFMGDIPLMTPQGTFIVNGAERVIVSQLHRSPGLAFEATQHANGKTLHSFRIIPDRGSWYEAQFDTNDMLWVYLDRKKRRRKFLATTFFRALGCSSDAEILKLFYEVEELPIKKLAKLDDLEIQNRVPAEDVLDLDNGGNIAHAFEPLSKEKVKKIADLNVRKIQVVNIGFDGGIIIKCLKKDPTRNHEEALKDIYQRLRPGDPPTKANAHTMIQRLFFDTKRYDLGDVGRYKINQKIGVKHWSQESVEKLGLGDSIEKCLKKENVETVGSLVLRQVEDLKLKLPYWSEEGVEELGLSASVVDFLKEQNVETVASLVRRRKEGLWKDWGLYVESKIQDYFKEAKIKTVGDLVEKTIDQLRDYPGYAEELFERIEEGLENYGKKQGVKLRIGMPSLGQRKKVFDTNLDELGLSERVQECLKGAKISMVKDLVGKKRADLVDQNTPQQTKRKPTIKDLYDLFGLEEKATPEQLQESYCKKVADYHPDKYEGGQASKELQAKAEEWSKRVNEANGILREYQEKKDKAELEAELDGKEPDYWNAAKYWEESGRQVLDAEDVKEIEKKLEEFGRKHGVGLHLEMSPSELDLLERALKKKIDRIFLIRESGKKVDEDALRQFGEGMVKKIEAALRQFGEKRFPNFYTGLFNGREVFVDLRLGMVEDELTEQVLEANDLVEATKYLLRLKMGKKGSVDDIDHLGSRRVRTVGELLANQCRVGLARTERLVKERMTLFDQGLDTMSPQKLINPKALSSVVRDFFGRSQLSQFMDQINPLAELTHKRRLSALGPGGLSRERAGFEVRDVHPSHYGRICPIETPEGPNIGLIASLAAFARVNDYGFIETPYRKVNKGRVRSRSPEEEGVEELGLSASVVDFLKEQNVETVASLVRRRKEGLWKDWGLYVESKIQDYFKEAKIKTVGDLVEKTIDQLRDYPGYAEELFERIEEGLENYGKKQGVKLRIGMPSLGQRKKVFDTNLDELGLSERVQECLKGAKISMVKDLVGKKRADLVDQNTPQQTKRKPTIKDLYDLFGLEEKATPEQLQESYCKKVADYHPDKYEGGQASKELQAKAEEWSKRVNEANGILREYQEKKDKAELEAELDGKEPDYWNAAKYWEESGRQVLDAEDVKEIEKKLEEFGRKHGVGLHLEMSPSELDLLERALKKKIDRIFLIRESGKKVDEDALRQFGEGMVKKIEAALRQFGEKNVENVKYLTADQEEKHVVAQANTSIKENGELERAMCRQRGDFLDVDPLECRTCKKNPDDCRCEEGFKDSVHYMDVSPKQLVSVAAGLIPFLEHDDANRALMGSNMQRQAVPLLVTEAPFVGTGLEKRAAQDSRSVVVANDLKEGGEYKVASVNFRLPGRKRREKEDNSRYIVITKDGKLPERRRLKHDPKNEVYLYQLRKFMRSNAATCINQKPLVAKGQIVKKGDVIADGPCTENGELALGRNVLCAFMPWNGYNFEDAVLISRRIVKDDVFTSIHIDEFEVNARDTKLGPEEITRDIPNLGEEALKDLGANGIIREGAEVKPGDILVGKVTPKSETELAPEEKLLRAIFGEKAADVKDSSLRVPSGTYGIVMEVRDVKKENERSSRSEMSESKRQARQIREDYERKRKELLNQLTEKLSGHLLLEKIIWEVCNSETAEIIIPANKKITKTLLKKLANNYDRLLIPTSPIRDKILEIIEPFKPKFEDLKKQRDEALDREEFGVEEEESGVVKSVKVFIASKRKLSVGDKMAGRHGNKGVVAQIVPEEDMPFLANGTPVDIVLNPLGVPSRMNVGQVLETHLGWAAKILGVSFATPIFDGIKEKGEEKNEERETLHNLLKKWRDESLSVASNQKEKESLREKLREYGVRDYLKAADDLVKEEDGVAWDFGMASSSSNGSAGGEEKKRACSLVKEDGKAVLYDGRTGEPFNQEVVVGYIYMLKLGHLVADKIHARAVGPYSLVTQQPLGGKAQYGGQRFGEMEVWAMEAYGAAHALQELITVKSDDVQGRTDIYASVVNGVNSLNARVPESFNVLVKEIQSLGMDVQVDYVHGRERPSLPSLVAVSPTLNSESEESHRV